MVGTVEVKGLPEVIRSMRDAGRIVSAVAANGLPRIGRVVVRTAVEYAPRSPTKAEYERTLKRKTSSSRQDFFPGGLEKSIEFETAPDKCVVFVRENSYAGKYAKRIHDERGVTWRNRGPGTIAKGDHAREKFIERAVKDCEDSINRIMLDEFDKAMRSQK